MQVGMIGHGRMGANMVRRLMKHGHQCVVSDVSPPTVQALAKEGAVGISSRGEAEFLDRLLSAMRYQFGGHLEKALDG